MKLNLCIGTALVSWSLCTHASAQSQTPSLPDNDVLLWNNVALQAIRDTHPVPTVVARDLAILQTGVFDAWAAYDSTAVGTKLGSTLRRPVAEQTSDNKNQAVSYAAYRTLVDLFPTQTSTF